MIKKHIPTISVTSNWSVDMGVRGAAACEWRCSGMGVIRIEDSVGRCGSWHTSELRQLEGVCEVCAFVCPWGSLWLGAALCIHLVFLMDENHAQANAKSTLCSHCSLVSIALEQICVFKTNYSRTHCTFSILFLFPFVWCLTLPSNLQIGAVLPEEHFCLCI